MTTNKAIYSDLAVPPGEYLTEITEEMHEPGWAGTAHGRSVQAISGIVNDCKSITPDTAVQLEQVPGVPAHIWTVIEAEYHQKASDFRDRAKYRRHWWSPCYPFRAYCKTLESKEDLYVATVLRRRQISTIKSGLNCGVRAFGA
jgi:plasmid maintenance system antidote protein VapI